MGKYDDIINHKYIKSSKRRAMTMVERAAQFGAFKAVTGHEDAVHETARLTNEKVELDEYAKQELNGRLNFLLDHSGEEPEVSITYFVLDEKKEGGAYQTVKGILSKIRDFERRVIVDGVEIPIDDILSIESANWDHA